MMWFNRVCTTALVFTAMVMWDAAIHENQGLHAAHARAVAVLATSVAFYMTLAWFDAGRKR